MRRGAALAGGAIALAVVSAALGQGFGPAPWPAVSAPAPSASAVERGRYLAVLGDCAGCHTRPGGEPMAGGGALNTPFGVIYSSNITPDRSSGIGGWSDEAFYKALHEGRRADGANLYPAMPYAYFTHLSRADTDALHAYLNSLKPVSYSPPANGLIFPLQFRPLVAIWNWLNFKRDDGGQQTGWGRGEFLVKGPGHCGACHTPKTLTASDRADQALQGGKLDNWFASDLTGDAEGGLAAWSPADIVEYLKTGRNAHGNAGGSMAEVVRASTSNMADQDLVAIAVYLKGLPASRPSQTYTAAPAARLAAGQAIYIDSCAGCHRVDGSGVARLFPPLANQTNIVSRDPTSLIRDILTGDETPGTAARPTPAAMPAYGWKLTDKQIADVTTYIRQSWGAHAEAVSPGQVRTLRRKVAARPVVKPSGKI